MLFAVLFVHAGALLIYRQSAVAAADEAFAYQIARQLVLAREVLLRLPPEQRNTAAKELSNPHFEIGWTHHEPVSSEKMGDPILWSLRGRILGIEPSLGDQLSITLGKSDDVIHHRELRGAIELQDHSFLVFRSDHPPELIQLGPWALLSTLMTIMVGGAAVFLMNRIAGPLRELARATALIGQGGNVEVREAGPVETRQIGRSLNSMQHRIHDLISQRTQALAAVSHDLRTPIARLRLRLDSVPDQNEKASMSFDLDEMQMMIDSTLAYLRGDSDPETRKPTNIGSLLISIADSASDAGRNVSYTGPSRALANVKPISLRRALDNIVDNAVRYGGCARIRLVVADGILAVTVDDDGLGIPPGDIPKAFEPFVRLESSRNRGSGGTGLGLTIARQAVEAENGTLFLSNRESGGLSVEVRLPQSEFKPT